MCDILNSNFHEKYAEILDDVNQSSFISIDCEFSGLHSDEENKPSLFDNPEERYLKLRRSANHFTIIQFGISAFKYNRETHGYSASSYTFYLCPKTFASVDKKLMFQSSAIEFLCNFKFDFNQLFYEGISYLNQGDEARLRKSLRDGSLFSTMERNLSYDEEDLIQYFCSKVASWAASSEETLLELHMENASDIIKYFVHEEIRHRFPNLWTFYKDQFSITVKKVFEGERAALQKGSKDNSVLQIQTFNSILGFSKLFQEIIALKKPVIGHNLWMDLIMIYNQFLEPLPSSYVKFKQIISKLFPVVYDTKFISFELRERLPKGDCWSSNSLSQLKEYFEKGKGCSLVLFMPTVKHKAGHAFLSTKFHDAGFDSYCTGYCFIRMAHLFSSWDSENSRFVSYPLQTTSSQHFAALSKMKNRVNIIRGQVNNINLNGPDPVGDKPQLLHIQSIGGKAVNTYEIFELIAKYGAIDIKPHAGCGALIAVGNHANARRILQVFRGHKDYKISRYTSQPSVISQAVKVGLTTLFLVLVLRQAMKLR